MNQLECMKIFVRVAELASFTQAADSLGIAKANVSSGVKQLENMLGTRLLQRTTRTVKMTQDGLVFYERSKDMLADMDELHTLFHQSDRNISGRLRVDMPNGIATRLIIPRLPEFLANYPRIDMELSCTDRRVDLIKEGFDCVIRVGTLADSTLIARPLGQFKLLNCASPAYLQQHGTPHTLADLSTHKMIHYLTAASTASGSTFDYQDGYQLKSIPVAGAISVNHTDSYQAACLAGLGIIQAPEIGVRELLEHGRLIELLPDYRAAPMPVSLLYVNRRHLPRRTQLLMNWIAEIMVVFSPG